MADGPNVPTCVLKVNIQCCTTCPEKVKKRLQKINDVYDIEIDSKNGLVSVRGTVQPSVLIQTISEKVGKKAELYSYHKNPDNQSELLADRNRCSPRCRNREENNRTCCFTDESNVDIEVKNTASEGSKGAFSWHNTQHGMRKKKQGFARWFEKKSNVEPPRMFSKFRGLRLPKYTRLHPSPSLPS